MIKHTSWQSPSEHSSLSPDYGIKFREWLRTPMGEHLLKLEKVRLAPFIPTLFGYYLLLVGEQDFKTCISDNKIKEQIVINDDLNDVAAIRNGYCYARRDRLPLDTNSIDVVYAAHSLEFAINPHEVLREIYRVMRGDGHLIITMFNPISLWGFWGKIARIRREIPWRANFMSVGKLKDWLALLGFDIIRINYFGYNLPLNRTRNSQSLSLCESIGQRLELPIGASYVIEATKKVIPLTPITDGWRTPAVDEEDLTEPTA